MPVMNRRVRAAPKFAPEAKNRPMVIIKSEDISRGQRYGNLFIPVRRANKVTFRFTLMAHAISARIDIAQLVQLCLRHSARQEHFREAGSSVYKIGKGIFVKHGQVGTSPSLRIYLS